METKKKFEKSVNESMIMCDELVAKLNEAYSNVPNKHISDISIKVELFKRDLKRVHRESQEFG